MAENDNIHEDIREMRGLLVDIAGKQSATNAKFDTLLEREMPALWNAARSAQTTASQAKAIASKANARLDRQNRYAAGWAAGASAVITAVFFAVKAWLSAKFGIHT
jgi:hypothetical protein